MFIFISRSIMYICLNNQMFAFITEKTISLLFGSHSNNRLKERKYVSLRTKPLSHLTAPNTLCLTGSFKAILENFSLLLIFKLLQLCILAFKTSMKRAGLKALRQFNKKESLIKIQLAWKFSSSYNFFNENHCTFKDWWLWVYRLCSNRPNDLSYVEHTFKM